MSKERRHGGDRRETVNHPEHYGGDTTYEAIKVIEAWGLDFHLGNTVKYLARAGKKGVLVEDLMKARWYLDRRIAQLERDTLALGSDSLPPTSIHRQSGPNSSTVTAHARSKTKRVNRAK
jgi:hypothetical protein